MSEQNESPPGIARAAAFFDVDGTVTTRTTMFRFLEFLFARLGHSSQVYHQARQRLREMTRTGISREGTNRAYFTNLQDIDAGVVDRVADDWFAAELDQAGLFNGAVISVLEAHRARGDLVVLVSGSFPACLLPIARHVRADVLICSLPEIYAGRYTGRVTRTMIGEEKAAAARELAARHDVDLDASTAYGDHLSDRELLAVVGRPIVVGDDPELLRHAQTNGWRVLDPSSPAAAI